MSNPVSRSFLEMVLWMLEGPPRTRGDLIEKFNTTPARASRIIRLLLDMKRIRFHAFRPCSRGPGVGPQASEYVPAKPV